MLIMVVDSNAICHKLKYGMANIKLSYEELRTEFSFGFLRQLLKYAALVQPDVIAFAWDSKKNFRKLKWDFYKRKRQEDREKQKHDDPEYHKMVEKNFYRQVSQIRSDILPKIGFKNNFIQTGMEADDLIASIVKNKREEDYIVIISTDGDLYQLLSPNVYMIKKNDKRYTAHDFLIEWEIYPTKWAKVKAMAGCSSDNVPGIPGVGEKTAIKYLNEVLPLHYKACKKIRANSDIIERNMPIVELPYEGTKDIVIVKDELKPEDFERVCINLSFEYLLREDVLPKWHKYITLHS